jgi:hypothetical protein
MIENYIHSIHIFYPLHLKYFIPDSTPCDLTFATGNENSRMQGGAIVEIGHRKQDEGY